ncbi:DUF4912 domain-containing protein [Paenibacillus sp. SI8]|uniref:DUF4912 domain-containing protein n=1 Tax=unclassified Paenibacillus TaxID=185978 RepID=UPI0034670D7F
MRSMPMAQFEVRDRYHKDLLHLMGVDAHTLFVYWEISNRRRWLVSQHFECDYDVMPKVLRVYDVTCILFNGSNAHSYRDVITLPEADSWYVRQLQPDRTYLIDIGTYTWEQEFVPLFRSNCAATPRDTMAAWDDTLRHTVPEAASAPASHRIAPHFFEPIQAYSPFMR